MPDEKARRGPNPNRKPREEWTRRPRKLTAEQVTADPKKCGHYGYLSKQDGLPCGAQVIPGTKGCRWHAGKRPDAARAQGAVVKEIREWGLGDSTVDPGETLLRLVTQSAWRAGKYAGEIEHMVAEAGGDLRKALTADQYTVGEDGSAVKVGEYIRAMVKLESEERDRCGHFAKLAVAAGLAERQVRLAEQQGAMLAAVIRAILGDPDLGLTAQQNAAAPAVVARHLRLVAA